MRTALRFAPADNSVTLGNRSQDDFRPSGDRGYALTGRTGIHRKSRKHQRFVVIRTVEIAREKEGDLFRVRPGSFATRAIFICKITPMLTTSDKLDGTMSVDGNQKQNISLLKIKIVMKSVVRLISLWALLVAVVGNAAVEVVVPVKSATDDKSYRGLVLENGLKVMLVTDPKSDRAAAALDVHVGSGSDPAEWNGLAHFLEHMLFLGNKKYPEAGQYQKFIQDHGGSNNAYTAYDHTNYFFSVGHDSLLPALDRFSRFFIDPTFEENYVDRERSVVHSEYQARIKDEGRRIWAAQKRILNPGHPASRFSVGSEQTLQDRDGVSVRDKLIEFYNRWYSADIMALTVVGRESLDQLEEWVTERFSEVPNKDITAPLYIQSYLNKELRKTRLDIIPDKELNSVSFRFAVPGVEEEYHSKPLGYIANLLGHEGKGSLLAALKAKGWADSLSAGAGFMDRQQGSFQVSIGLTEPGVEHIEEIGTMLFHTIELIRQHGIEQWRFEEEKQLGEIGFRFAEESQPGGLAQSLASRLHDYPMVDVLRGPYIMDQFDPERIRQMLSYLTPDRVYLQVVSQGLKVRKVSPWYGVVYGIEPIGADTILRWQREMMEGIVDNNPGAISLPPPNPFIPTRLTLQSLEGEFEKPYRLPSEPGLEAWYRPDQEFRTPRSSFYFSIKSLHANSSAKNTVLTELLVRMINDQLDAFTYPARLAGLSYSLYRHSRGISARIGGYQDGQKKLLEVLLDAIERPVLDPDKLELIKAELARELSNTSKDRPSNQTVHEIYRLLMNPYWTEQERLMQIKDVTAADLVAHKKLIVSELMVTTLAHGDVSEQQAEAMGQSVIQAFPDADFVNEVKRQRIRRLDASESYLRSMDIDHTDSALTIYLQGGHKSRVELAKSSLLGQLMESPFYFDLRTTHRVGYLVYSVAMNILKVPGILLSVQSPTHGVTEIDELIEQFLTGFPAQLDAMTEAEFDQIKGGLAAKLRERDTRLSERSSEYWRQIDLEEYNFDSTERLAQEIETLSKSDMRSYIKSIFDQYRRQITVQSQGRREGAAKFKLDADGQIVTGTAEEFRQSAVDFFPAL